MKQLNLLSDTNEQQDVTTDIFDYRPGIFSRAECERYLRIFLNDVPWEQTSQLIYGKKVNTPRLTAWYGDLNTDYSVKGEGSPTLFWTPDLREIKAKVEAISGITFNSVLLNYYRDQNDSVAWHSDRDGVPGRNKYVASVSFGQERLFDLRKKDYPTKAFSVMLEDGSYLLMKGVFQDQWQHRVAKSCLAMGPRINLTYRISSKQHE